MRTSTDNKSENGNGVIRKSYSVNCHGLTLRFTVFDWPAGYNYTSTTNTCQNCPFPAR
jgi:hypothetical protein